MPLLQVPRFRCKTCQDSGLVMTRVVNPKHPQVADRLDPENRNFGLDLNAGLNVAPGRWHEVELPCTDCPPAPTQVPVRDWVRPS